MQRALTCIVLLTLALISGGCETAPVKKTTKQSPGTRPVAKDATQEELLDKYNVFATGVKTINTTVELKPTAGSKYSGVIDEYHEVKAFLLAARPAQIRVIGQVPVIGKTVFDMASDANTFQVSIPSKNKFLVGPVALDRSSSKPIENLRPQHLLEALLWPEIRKEESVLFEEFNDEDARYYVLTILRGGYRTEILRKVWFDRADLNIVRLQNYGSKGTLLCDTHYSDWQPLPVAQQNATAAASSAINSFPNLIRVVRPHDDYRLDLQILTIFLNADIPAERFQLEQPAGSELVHVGDSSEEKPQ
jgi:outer membrane lipoprotein-sorting protein